MKSLSWLLMLPFVLIGAMAVKRGAELTKPGFIRIPPEIQEGVSFHGEIIIVKEKSDIRFLSSKCTHLGCQINSIENNKLTCPCHGSSFSLNGNNIKGPADSALAILDFSIDEGNGEYVVKLG
ncbi:MAG: Rieske 2Fe-2S domain-containing protein [Chlorobi bacterium]|nr:Rieske 2Fe-2S domain-containing protein [Chlorobiota bacterium]